jgi:alkylated DNA nucleotide flippase Atl1
LGPARIAQVATLVGRGEWTTYGEIARVALGGRGARVVGGGGDRGEVGHTQQIPLAGGRISPGGGPRWAAEVRRRLEGEGVRFQGSRADPRRHLTWLDLESRLGDQAAGLGGGVG